MNAVTDINANNKEYVKELQHYLRAIATFDKRIPLIAIDGIYSPKTASAVSAFQTNYSLPITGETDENTWLQIFKHYKIIADNFLPAKLINGFKTPSNIIRIGDKGYSVLLLQVMIKAIGDRFENIKSVDITGVYDVLTDNEVKRLQAAALIDTTGVDKQSWNCIVDLFNSLK